ncbi:MAG TPA: 4Fe-4S dicluster domain-containing protein, partial [Thermoanaerobaculia bacterium]|nr:4Fe-4S dicluster domain-containing protein [Thermoanaerobaculia bacterium]
AAGNFQTGASGVGLEITFRPDPTIHDGRFANNGWLQELPKPITKVTWDNVAAVSPATAARLGVANEDVLELALSGRRVRAPVWIVPGHPDDSVGVTLGYGRTKAGRLGSGTGFDAYAIRPSTGLWQSSSLDVRKTGDRRPVAVTQSHHAMEGRNLARTVGADELRRNPEAVHEMGEAPGPEMTLYQPHPSHGYAWGMAIDLGSCVGCNACVVACTAENNVPIVGKDQVVRGREMQWLRIDHYAEGDPANPRQIFQPVPCMHCETAPCELVCPTAATVHSAEGLNDMVYNRCVGTRYCSNNCPYKVRRFNFYHWSTQFRAPSMRMLANPDVTVRWRGVMEKCTYCVQRINEGKIRAELENRRVRDGEIVTACQQACPAEAIVFGDLADPQSRVSKLRGSPLSYGLLAELGTRPRTTYLAAVGNPNRELGEVGRE